jgi:hypothetical protein
MSIRRLRAYWLTPAGLVILGATIVGLLSRGFLLTRPGFLTSGTVEYDDGVYLGATIRLLQGALPYRDFAFVQPPGILVISLPFALVARVISASAGLAAARLVTVCAGAACVPLAGNLVRHRGALAALVTCGFLAVYPADVLASRTLLLEPWMNLLCLLAANAAFRQGKLASPWRLGWAGAVIGFAVAVKFWAAVPAALLLAWILLTREDRIRRVRAYLPALAAGFVVPVAPLAAGAPAEFARSTVFDQVTRMGSYTPLTTRLAYLTGFIDFIDGNGHLNFSALKNSAFAQGSNGTMVIDGISWEPWALMAAGAGVLALAYLRRPASRSQLEWFALAVAVMASVAVSAYSAFFYHYPDFPAPWLAIAFGAAAGSFAGAAGRIAAGPMRVSPLGRLVAVLAGSAGRIAVACVAIILVAAAALQARELSGQSAPPSPQAVGKLVPAGACVYTDQVSFIIAADRFTASRPGCPDVLDSLAQTLVLSNGVSVPGGAGDIAAVTHGWRSILDRAQYVWLSQGYQARIPWTSGTHRWFTGHFRLVRSFPGYGASSLYEKIP